MIVTSSSNKLLSHSISLLLRSCFERNSTTLILTNSKSNQKPQNLSQTHKISHSLRRESPETIDYTIPQH
ncbi:hypothetical protein BRARA_I00134 [Brassica rapa]|uniref:Uncharacterized protein n=1 Tax=Brassica campestris TaxID=3711 RepID=A0A397XYH5_BRACM|nr:hypothetical protein BRARA_I00134 [Brassica rapa]